MAGHILVAHPTATERIHLRERLENNGYTVSTVMGQDDLDSTVQRGTADIALISSQMLRNHTRSLLPDHVPLLVLAGNSALDRINALSFGADDVISSPMDTEFLVSKIRALLRSYGTGSLSETLSLPTQPQGFCEPATDFEPSLKVSILSANPTLAAHWAASLGQRIPDTVETLIPEDLFKNLPDLPGICVVDAISDTQAALLLQQTLSRNFQVSRTLVLHILDGEKAPDAARRLMDERANDVMLYGFEPKELAFRVSRLIRHNKTRQGPSPNACAFSQTAHPSKRPVLFGRKLAWPLISDITKRARDTGSPFAILLLDPVYVSGQRSSVERLLQRCLPAQGVMAHFRNEQFLVLLPDIGRTEARSVALRLQTELQKANSEAAGNLTCPLSIGVAIGQQAPGLRYALDGQTLVDLANQALICAKQSGRACIRFASETGSVPMGANDDPSNVVFVQPGF